MCRLKKKVFVQTLSEEHVRLNQELASLRERYAAAYNENMALRQALAQYPQL